MSDEPTERDEAERLLRALRGVTWEGEPVSAAVERVIAEARREGAAEALDEAAAAGPSSTVTDGLWQMWLRDRADAQRVQGKRPRGRDGRFVS